jgi:hypothetical protein
MPMKKYKISDYDIVYLSYDEPNAEKNYADLLTKFPWAKRVHKVKGFDAAHRACADIATTDRFVLVDGDNIVFPKFFDYEFEMPEAFDCCTFSWNSINVINGIIYGNGGLKLWTKEFIYTMNSHENATGSDVGKAVEFCWDPRYYQMNDTFSLTCPNETPWQAFRAGFREGAKLPLDTGVKVPYQSLVRDGNKYNMSLVYRWMSLGMDARNGIWAILGARDGFIECQINDMDITKINNSDAMREYMETKFGKYSEEELVEIIKKQGAYIFDKTSIDLELFDAKQSAIIKRFDVTYNSAL